MGASVDSDALTIARWCWPDAAWAVYEHRGCEVSHVRPTTSHPMGEFRVDSRAQVAAAESVVIERGHAEAYGKALVPECAEIDGWNEDRSLAEAFAQVATAPIEARVRAMAAVIRALTPEPTR